MDDSVDDNKQTKNQILKTTNLCVCVCVINSNLIDWHQNNLNTQTNKQNGNFCRFDQLDTILFE